MHPDWEVLSSGPLGLTHHHRSHGHGPLWSPLSLPPAPLALTLFLMLLSSLLEFQETQHIPHYCLPPSATPLCLTGTLWGPEKPLSL